MSQDAPKTLFEIVNEVLSQFKDSNLQSDEAREKIADEICDKYYTEIEIPYNEDYDGNINSDFNIE